MHAKHMHTYYLKHTPKILNTITNISYSCHRYNREGCHIYNREGEEKNSRSDVYGSGPATAELAGGRGGSRGQRRRGGELVRAAGEVNGSSELAVGGDGGLGYWSWCAGSMGLSSAMRGGRPGVGTRGWLRGGGRRHGRVLVQPLAAVREPPGGVLQWSCGLDWTSLCCCYCHG